MFRSPGGACSDRQFQCENTRCIGKANVCDGVCDCSPDCDDERGCGEDKKHRVTHRQMALKELFKTHDARACTRDLGRVLHPRIGPFQFT